MFFFSTKAKKINILRYFQAASKKCLGLYLVYSELASWQEMQTKKGSPSSGSVTSSKCAVKHLKKKFCVVFPDLLFHLLEKAVLVGLDKLEVAGGVIDSYLINLCHRKCLHVWPSLPSLFFFLELCSYCKHCPGPIKYQ